MSRDKKSVLSSSGVPAEDDRDERSEPPREFRRRCELSPTTIGRDFWFR